MSVRRPLLAGVFALGAIAGCTSSDGDAPRPSDGCTHGPAFGPGDPGCVGQVAAWIEHSTDDVVVEITQGERSRDYWGAANGCDLGSPIATTPAGCVAYPGCDEGFPVRWCVSAGGHAPRPDFTAAGAWNFFGSL